MVGSAGVNRSEPRLFNKNRQANNTKAREKVHLGLATTTTKQHRRRKKKTGTRQWNDAAVFQV